MRSHLSRHQAPIAFVIMTAVGLSTFLAACSAPTSVTGAGPGSAASTSPSAPSSASASPGIASEPAEMDDLAGEQASDDTSYRPDDWREHQWPGDTPETKPVSEQGRDRSIATIYSAQGGISLREGWFRGSGSWSKRVGNVDSVDSKNSFTLIGDHPAFMYRHRIYEGGKPTEFWLGTKFGSPNFGSNEWNCDVFRGDPAGEGEWAWVSPYVCTWDNVRGSNPEPVVTVKKATVVTNKRDASRLLADTCNADNGQRKCRYYNVGFGKGIGERTVVGSVIINSGTAKGTKTVKWTEKNGTTNSVGVDVSVGVKIAKIFSFEVSTHYEHEWLWEHTFGDETEVDLESETAQWVEYAAPFQTAIGNWVIDTGNETFLVPDITFKAPITNGGRTYVVTCPLEEYNDDGTCDVQPWSKLKVR